MEQETKKHKCSSELAFVWGTLLLAVGIALMEKSHLGMSMVASMSYIISLGIPAISYGTADYLLEGALLIGFFILVKRFSIKHLLSFLSAFIFGVTLDGVMWLVRDFTAVTLVQRICWFIPGWLINSLGVAVFLKTYLPLQVYELFVIGMVSRFGLSLKKAKTIFDCSCCLCAIALSLLFFGELRAIGVGTVACAALNGTFIGAYTKFMDEHMEFVPKIPALYTFFREK